MPNTRTPLAASWPLKLASASFIMAWNTGCRARYTLVTSPLTLSALARLLAVVFSRMVSALRALPATLNTLNKDIFFTPLGQGAWRLLARNDELQLGDLAVDEHEARLVADVVL